MLKLFYLRRDVKFRISRYDMYFNLKYVIVSQSSVNQIS